MNAPPLASAIDALWQPPPRRIAVFRALQLGDMLCAIPALRALRLHAPQARITLVGLPWARALVERFPRYLDELLVFPGAPGFPEQPIDLARWPAFAQAARERGFDLAIQLHGSGERSNPIVAQLGARHCVGFAPEGARSVPGFRHVLPWPRSGSEIRRALLLMESIGVAPQGTALEFPLGTDDWTEAERLMALHRLEPGAFVCLHPGARLPSRRWPAERFAAVGAELVAQGLRVVVTGAADEAPLVGTVAAAIPGAIDLGGRTSLGGLAALIAAARQLVSNDTGVSHVAAAVGTPSVVIACGSEVVRWAPLDHLTHRVLASDLPCRPCAHVQCPIGHPCATNIGVDSVLAESRRLLEHAPRHA